MDPFLEMEKVSVARGEAVVLHEVSLRIERGEHLAILGPNGCGKSTLIKTITRDCYPMIQPGSVLRLLGHERWDVSQLRQHLGVVQSELPGQRTPHVSGLDAVVAGYFSASSLWPNLHVTSAMRAGAEAALALLHATHLACKPVGEMSAGEQRRVMVARAMVHRPEMLLLDEPANALDLAAQHELREALRQVARAGTGILMVTHHLGDILPEIHRVLFLRGGRVLADGPREELLQKQPLEALFGTQLELGQRRGYIHAW